LRGDYSPCFGVADSWGRSLLATGLSTSDTVEITSDIFELSNCSKRLGLRNDDSPAGWVRVRIAPGQWVGGRFADGSYFSTYPESRDLFIEDQYVVKEDGSFGERVPSSSGVWLSIRDDYVVEWLADEPGQE
jgi:hypothetical protein